MAEDGRIGKVHEFYFDDRTWTVRYIVADTGNWLVSRLVLISPEAFKKADWEEGAFSVDLTTEEVENSPPIEKDRPFYLEKEYQLRKYYDWSLYWGEGSKIGDGCYGGAAGAAEKQKSASEGGETAVKEGGMTHLRSTRKLWTYDIMATDEPIGKVDDFIVDDVTWTIRYMIVDTGRWIPGKKVIISPVWIDEIDWFDHMVWVHMPKETIRNAPAFEPSKPVNRKFEVRLYDYYGRPRYWESEE